MSFRPSGRTPLTRQLIWKSDEELIAVSRPADLCPVDMRAECAGLKPACASALNPLVPLLLELGAGREGEVATAMLPCPALRWHVCTHSRSEGLTRRLCATEPSGLRATVKGQHAVPCQHTLDSLRPPPQPPYLRMCTCLRPLRKAGTWFRLGAGVSNKQGQPCVEPVEQDELCFDCEDVEVAHSAFLTAHRHSRPENVQVEGMQDFAAAVTLLAEGTIERRVRSGPPQHDAVGG
jgi:hypothetical protein